MQLPRTVRDRIPRKDDVLATINNDRNAAPVRGKAPSMTTTSRMSCSRSSEDFIVSSTRMDGSLSTAPTFSLPPALSPRDSIRESGADLGSQRLDYAWMDALTYNDLHKFQTFARNMTYLERYWDGLPDPSYRDVFADLQVHVSGIHKITEVKNSYGLMRHMNGWLSLFIVATFNHNFINAIVSTEGLKGPSPLRNKEYERIKRRFVSLRNTLFAGKLSAGRCDGAQSLLGDGLVLHYEFDELGSYQRLMQDIKAHLKENVLPSLPSLNFPPRKKFSGSPRRGSSVKLSTTHSLSWSGINVYDVEERGLPVSNAPPETSYPPEETSLSLSESIPFTTADVYTQQSTHTAGEKAIPVLNVQWLTKQREAPSLRRLNDCVRYIKLLQQDILQQAHSSSPAERLTAFTNTLDDTPPELQKCLGCKSVRIHTITWFGFLAVVLYRIKAKRPTTPYASLLFSDLIEPMRKLKTKSDKDFATGCHCDWHPVSAADDVWPFIETLLSNTEHVFAGIKNKRDHWEAVALAEREAQKR